jgi:hypothetical protein
MRQQQLRLFTILVLGLVLPPGLHAQETLPASGADAYGNGGSVSYTIGQVLYMTLSGTDGSIAEGVQQPFEISVVVGIEEANGINLLCRAYPNPATDHVVLEIEFPDTERYFFQLYNMAGIFLVREELTDIRTTIPMQNLAPSTYFLSITANQKVVKTFKIIKNQ